MSATLTDKWLKRLESDVGGLVRLGRREIVRQRVKIAILDTGIDVRNVAFAHAVSKSLIKEVRDFAEPGGDGLDVHGHGTHSAALLCRIAPEAEIYVARVTKGDKSPDPNLVAKAIHKAVSEWHVDLISLSLGFYGFHRALHDAVKLAYCSNTIIFAAASNNGTSDAIVFPARVPGVVCIHAANALGQPSPFNPVPELDKHLSILGEDVESAWCCGPRGKVTPEQAASTKRKNGTSVATPIAAGLMALIYELARQPAATQRLGIEGLRFLQSYDGVNALLKEMSRQTGGYGNIVPWGLLKGNDAVRVANVIRFILEKEYLA